MKALFFLLSSIALAQSPTPAPVKPAEPPKQQYTFVENPKPTCSLIDGKLVLGKMWPLGSWEACAYSILQIATQLDMQVNLLRQELQKLQPVKK